MELPEPYILVRFTFLALFGIWTIWALRNSSLTEEREEHASIKAYTPPFANYELGQYLKDEPKPRKKKPKVSLQLPDTSSVNKEDFDSMVDIIHQELESVAYRPGRKYNNSTSTALKMQARYAAKQIVRESQNRRLQFCQQQNGMVPLKSKTIFINDLGEKTVYETEEVEEAPYSGGWYGPR